MKWIRYKNEKKQKQNQNKTKQNVKLQKTQSMRTVSQTQSVQVTSAVSSAKQPRIPGKGGRGSRSNSNRPPPGAVNLERSYQICQAVIQNSPNRHQLKAQLRPPPSMLASTNNNTTPGSPIAIEKRDDAATSTSNRVIYKVNAHFAMENSDRFNSICFRLADDQRTDTNHIPAQKLCTTSAITSANAPSAHLQ